MESGVLRQDIELISPGKHGDFFMLFDPQADAYYRITAQTMQILALLNRSYTEAELLQHTTSAGIDAAAEDILRLFSFLKQNNLTVPQYGEIIKKQHVQQEQKKKTTFLRLSAAYLFFRLPPWRPEKLLQRLRPYIKFLASKPFLYLLAIPAFLGYLLAIRNFGKVCSTFADTLSWAVLGKYFITIIFLKVIHEAAHAIAATRFNCRVRGIGLGFMVFYPRLFTDTTDSWRLPRRQRLLIDSAGIIAELLMGGIAALLWFYLAPGAMQSTMFYIFAVSSLSTLQVNGNPCIRYDGYYILCDLVKMENLMTRSAEYVKSCWRWYLLHLGKKPAAERGCFLFCFGVCSFVYRLFLYTSIILLIYQNFTKVLAIIMLILELYSILIYPCWREFKTIYALSRRSVSKSGVYLLSFVLLIAGAILFMPLSWSFSIPGEVIAEQVVLLSAKESGYLKTPIPHTARFVRKGTVIADLDSPHLDFSRRRLEALLTQDLVRWDLQQRDKTKIPASKLSWEKLKSDRLAADELLRRQKDLVITAESDGIFVPHFRKTDAGSFVPKGAAVGKLISGETRIQAYAADQEFEKLKPGISVTIRCPDTLKQYTGTIHTVDPVPARLKDSPLLQLYGGSIPVYPDAKGEHMSLLPMYRIEIIPEKDFPAELGRSVSVKIRHSERLAERIWTFLIFIFRKEF